METVTASHNAAGLSCGLLLNIKQVAAFLGVTTRTLHREIARGRFPKPIKIGHASRFARADVEAFISAQRSAASS